MSKLRELSRNSAIYGLGDVAIQAVNFLLLPLYVRYLSATDYGILALLAAVEAGAKLFFRWGIDGAFMRFWYDCDDDRERQRLTSTIVIFLVVVNGVLAAAAIVIAPLVSTPLFDHPGYTLALQLVLLNTFAIGFTFIPFHVLRIQNKAAEYSALALARSVTTVVGRLILVVGFGWGVMGIVWTDLVVTVLVILVLLPWFAPLVRGVFSRDVLRAALAFGLPRVPHGLALQVMAVADRFILQKFRSIGEIGMYSMGVSFGLIPKIALAAFEAAWAPFYYATSREPDAPRVFSLVTTYGVAALAVMTAGLAATAHDLLALMTRGQFVAAAPVVTWTAVGVFFYGIYLLTSIGLNITKNTRYYPVSTAIGAVLNVALNLVLIPRFGMVGAAWANGATYAVQSGIAFKLSQRFYPIAYEHGRIARAVLAALLGYAAAASLPHTSPLLGVALRGTTVVGVVALILAATRFFHPGELRRLGALRSARKGEAQLVSAPDTTEMAGEIVSIDMPEEVMPSPGHRKN